MLRTEFDTFGQNLEQIVQVSLKERGEINYNKGFRKYIYFRIYMMFHALRQSSVDFKAYIYIYKYIISVC